MKNLILLFILLLPNIIFSQVNGGVRLYLSGTNDSYQIIVNFSDQSTDGVDSFDAISFGQSDAMCSYIGQYEYVINSFSQLTDDRWIPIGLRAHSETFEIGVNLIIGDEIPLRIWDSTTGQLYELPHQFNGPVNSSQRFKLFFEYPLQVSVTNNCDTTIVHINDDASVGEYTLLYGGNVTTVNSDTFYIFQDGEYELQLQGDTVNESVSFGVQNLTNDYIASLNLPLTSVPIFDPIIIPLLDLNYNPSQIIWNFGDGTFVYNDINPVHYYTSPGLYNLTCIIISEDGCEKIFNSLILVYVVNGIDPIIKNGSKYPLYYGLDGRLMRKN